MKTLLFICCCLPLKHLHLNSAFGYRVHPITKQYKFHNGIDLRACHDTVYAVFDGAASVHFDQFLGVYITVSDGAFSCYYGHLSYPLTSAGPVISGQAIAITGATGRVTAEHLHFSIKFKGHDLDPLKFLYQLTIKSNNHE